MDIADRSEGVAYHYSLAYRDVAATAFDAAGLRVYVYDDPEAAKSQLSLCTKALITPYERFTLSEDRSNLDVTQPSTELLRFAELYNIPFALLMGIGFDLPIQILEGAHPCSAIIAIGEAPTFTAEERVSTAEIPDEPTQLRVTSALTSWLQRIDASQ